MNRRSFELISRVSLGPCSSGTNPPRGGPIPGSSLAGALSGEDSVHPCGGGPLLCRIGRRSGGCQSGPHQARLDHGRQAPQAGAPPAIPAYIRRSRNPRNRTPPRPVTFWAGCHRPSPNRRPRPTCKSAARLVVTSSPSAPMGAFPIWTLRSRFWREPSRLINPGSRPLNYMGRRHLRSLKLNKHSSTGNATPPSSTAQHCC